jgi:hypothetical protein
MSHGSEPVALVLGEGDDVVDLQRGDPVGPLLGVATVDDAGDAKAELAVDVGGGLMAHQREKRMPGLK